MKQNKKEKEKEKEISEQSSFNKKLGDLCPVFMKEYLKEYGEKEFYQKYYKLTKFLPQEFKYIFNKKIRN